MRLKKTARKIVTPPVLWRLVSCKFMVYGVYVIVPTGRPPASDTAMGHSWRIDTLADGRTFFLFSFIGFVSFIDILLFYTFKNFKWIV